MTKLLRRWPAETTRRGRGRRLRPSTRPALLRLSTYRPTLRRGVAVVGTTGLAVAGAVAGPALVQADTTPQRALQAVTVRMGTDGSITGLSSALLSRPDGATRAATSSSSELDPAKFAGKLPVRITTSWSHQGKVGTNLADLRGASGRVEVMVTVQNTTVHPERFQYDALGQPQDRYELVATPLTVVASARLGEGDADRVVSPRAGAVEPGTTNGVLSRQGGATTVQWASLLAPPRLAATTTFTLVEDAKNFQVPQFTLSVQPGLATDASVARLVSDVFGAGAGLQGESATIALIARINTTLTQVTDSLAAVRETLTTNANEIGDAAARSLVGTADAVDSSSQAVIADLTALRSSVTGTVASADTTASDALTRSVTQVLDYFGDPGSPGAAPTPTAGACGTSAAPGKPADTLLGQLSAVSGQLRGLAAASDDCVAAVRASLLKTIGTGDGSTCQVAKGETPSLTCRLQGAAGDLTDLAGSLQTDAQGILGAMKAGDVDQVKSSIDALVAAVAAAQHASQISVTDDTTTVDDVAKALDQLGGLIDQAESDLSASTVGVPTSTAGDLRSQLDALHTLAEQRIQELGGLKDTAAGLAAQLQAATEDICTYVAAQTSGQGNPTMDPTLEAAKRLLDGQDCAKTDPQPSTASTAFPTPLDARISGELDADLADWQKIATDTDVNASSSGAALELKSLTDQLGTASTQLTDAVSTLETLRGDLAQDSTDLQNASKGLHGKAGDLQKTLDALTTQLAGLYDANAAAPACGTPAPANQPPLNALAADFSTVQCEQGQVATNLQGLLDRASAQVKDLADSGLLAAQKDLQAAGQQGVGDLSSLSGTLSGQLGSAADSQAAQGAAVVAAQKQRLAAVQAAADHDLGAAAQQAVAGLSDQVARAVAQQSDAADALQAQLRAVLLDLGSAQQGKGLLGVVQDSAGQTGVGATQVQQVGQAASSYRQVRLSELADAQLEQQQMSRCLAAAQSFPAFGAQLPQGSVAMTVFVVTIGSEA